MGLVVSAISRVGSITTRPTSIAMIAALLFVANLLGWFPGVPNDDSNSQYAQALDRHFNDWHPPIMAWLWSMFRLLADGNGPMFSFHIACYWLGFGLIAVALSRIGRPLAAWGIIGVGLFPPFLMMNINILKDVGLAVTFLAAFAALFWYRIQDRKVPLVVVAISAVLLFYGTLVRSNAVFGVVPLLAYLINPRWLGRPWRLLAFSAPAAMLLVPVSGLINHSVLNATPVGIIRSLEIFDMAGIAFYSGDVSVFGPGNSFTRQDVDSCYTPILWDTLSPWGECRFFWNRLAVARDLQGVEKLAPMAAMEARPNPELLNHWVASIIAHPLAYARHRLAHFSSAIYFLAQPRLGDMVVLGALEHVPMKRNHCAAQLTAPSPRLPSGRLRPSATGYGEGRGEGTSPQAQTRGEAPSPGAQERADLSPQAGRGKEAAASISSESALVGGEVRDVSAPPRSENRRTSCFTKY